MFHVPETARIVDHPRLGSTAANGNNGAFRMPSPEPGWDLWIIASDGTELAVPEALGWEHVSVHAHRARDQKQRTPTWKEMAHVKAVFWDTADCVVEYHVPATDHINVHQHVLHLWRHREAPFPRPPQICV